MRGVQTLFAFVVGGIVLGIAGAIMLFAWRVTQHLTEMSTGIILGIAMTALVVGLILLPLTYLLVRNRQADMYEFLAAQSRMKAPTFDVSVLEPPKSDGVAFRGGGVFSLDNFAALPDDLDDF